MANKKFLKIDNYYSSLKFPNKYVGDKKIVTIRSSLELEFVLKCDNNVNILEWSSEDKVIKYKDLKGKYHRYYVDFYIKYINNNGIISEKYIEVKPYYQLMFPLSHYSIKTKSEFVKNRLKWNSTYEYCSSKNIKFDIYTEKGVVSYEKLLKEYYENSRYR